MQPSQIGPVALQERIQTIDIIRGIALLGIFIVNLTVDNPGMTPMQGRAGFFDQLVYWPIKFFLNNKFINIYCFLFGLGFSIQLLRAKANNSNFIIIYIRRLMILFLFGALIKIFISGRGVLDEYAMAGVLLLILYKLPKIFLHVLAAFCIFLFWTRDTVKRQQQMPSTNIKITIDTAKLDSYVGVYQLSPKRNLIFIRRGSQLSGEGLAFNYRLIPLSDSEFRYADRDGRITFLKDSAGNMSCIILNKEGRKIEAVKIKTDLQLALKEQQEKRKSLKFEQEKLSYKQFVVRNAKRFWGWLKYMDWKDVLWEFLRTILPVFLIGAYAGRRKIFSDISSNRLFIKNVMKWCLLIGMTGISMVLGFDAFNFVSGNPNEAYYRLMLWYRLCWDIGSIIMALGIIAWLTLQLEKKEWKKRFSFFIPVGRMGLTNYFLSLIIGDRFILGEQGFDLAGRSGPFLRFVLALVSFALIVFISRLWFKYFKMGPLEWLWRSLTYLKFQPMRLKPSNKTVEKEMGSV